MISFFAVIFPIIAGFALLIMRKQKKDNDTLLICAVTVTLLLTLSANFLSANTSFVFLDFPLMLEFSLSTDPLSVLFTTLIALIWVVVAVYSLGYMSHLPRENHFYAYFLITLGMLLGVCYADNLITMYMFFELMSVSAFALVVHERTAQAINAGKKFLFYSLFGASMGLLGIFYFYNISGDISFGGINRAYLLDSELSQLVLFLMIVGFSCKAGMYPLHSWLSAAHPVAPAPASSVLSGLITKGGVIAIIRIIYYYIGASNIQGTFVQTWLIYLSLITIFMGSLMALRAKVIKKRLAYSSVSQISYVLLGLFMLNAMSFTGALLQVVFHALAKNLLFLCAGLIIHSTGYGTVDKLTGLGKKMPLLFCVFTIGALSLVGIPLTAGFVSKWYLAIGALGSQTNLGLISVAVIMISAMLTAGYLFKVSSDAFFKEGEEIKHENSAELKPMYYSTAVLAIAIIVLGIYPQPMIEFITSIATSVFGGGI